jgi:hypothetical protein
MHLVRNAFIGMLALGLVSTAAPACAGVRLNEIMPGPASDWDGSGVFSSRDDEWVEIVNTGPAAVDLGGFLLTDEGDTPRYALAGSLAAGARLLVYGGDSFAWERANGFPAFGLSLGNTGDAVKLWHVAAGETLLVESFTYPAHAAAADRSVGRSPDGSDEWRLFDGMNPYSGSADPSGSGCDPTPGQANACGSTPASGLSWGRLKTLYLGSGAR